MPLVFALYGSTSKFLWWDDDDRIPHEVAQGEGGEQGDPLMPALFSLALHDALVEADGNLMPGEHLTAFLDDLYLWTCPARAAAGFHEVAEVVEQNAGIRTNLGELQMWSATPGPAPPDAAALGPETWTANKSDETNGITILGTPLGTPAFVKKFAAERMEAESKFLAQIAQLPDLQTA